MIERIQHLDTIIAKEGDFLVTIAFDGVVEWRHKGGHETTYIGSIVDARSIYAALGQLLQSIDSHGTRT